MKVAISDTTSKSGKHRKAQKLPPYNLVRAYFVAHNSSLRRWARENGYHRQQVEWAVRGVRRGPVSNQIVAKIKKETGL